MMRSSLKILACATFALLLAFHSSYAGTIIKLSLSNNDPDVQYVTPIMSTVNDLNVATTGDQDTDIQFSDFLSGMGQIFNGSYTLSGTTAVGPAVTAGVVYQNFVGGNFKIWDNANVLLLNVNMNNSVLAGGGSNTGSLFNIDNGNVIGGSLAPLIVANSVNMSLSLTNISTGQLLAPGGVLVPFTADASKSIAGLPTPEPASWLLALLSCATFLARRSR
jgi:hypothetical protein